MRLLVSEEVCRLFPALRIAVVVGTDMDNRANAAKAAALFDEEAVRLRSSLQPAELDSLPEIVAWREAYDLVGHKSKRNRPSAESLIRSVLGQAPKSPISPIVDVYLAAQLRCRLPIGGYDLGKIHGDITLRRSPGGEPFVPIGSSKEPDSTKAGEVVYADDDGVLTRRWNWRDGDSAKITIESRDIVLMSEAPSDAIATESLQGLAEFLARHLRECCGGQVQVLSWSADQPEPLVIR